MRITGYAGVAAVIGLVVALAVDGRTSMGASAKGARLRRMQASPQYHDGRFVNPLGVKDGIDGEGHVSWGLASRWLGGGEVRVPRQPPPVLGRRRGDFAAPPRDHLRLTWLGHSSFLIEIDGRRVLTDPVWGRRASPFRFLGPRRFFPPPLALSELPALDAVVVSHDHYDHLDQPTIAYLCENTAVTFYVPLGVGAHLERWGVPEARIVELDWWEERTVSGLTIAATPARHFSGRGLHDRNATLWNSWAIVGPGHRVFFSGDTGMFPGFAEIGQRFGPFDVTMIETGGYSALWADVHLGPEQALRAHQELRGGVYVPAHWGTFGMSMHGWTEPVERLLVVAEEAGVRVVIPRPGDSVEPGTLSDVEHWWPSIPWQRAVDAPIVSSGMD